MSSDHYSWTMLLGAVAGFALWKVSVQAGGSGEMVSRDLALSGRKEEMRVSDTHFVLGTPMRGPWPEGMQMFVFANGCFWGSEKGIWRLPLGIYSTAVGYAAGFTPNPTYEEVGSDMTGHAEAVQVIFDPAQIGLPDLVRWFWEAHDPTQGMGQGNDRGTSYRSGLYYFDEDQRQLFEASKDAYQKALASAGRGRGRHITTEIRAAADFPHGLFFYAEDYHQQYLAKPGARPYCSAQPQRVSLPSFAAWAPATLREKFTAFLQEDFWEAHAPKPHSIISSPNTPISWKAQGRRKGTAEL